MEPRALPRPSSRSSRVGPRDVGVGVPQIDDPVDPGVHLRGDEVRITIVVEQAEDRGHVVEEQLERTTVRPLTTRPPRSILFENSTRYWPGVIDRELDVRLAVGTERQERIGRRHAERSASASRKFVQQ